MIKIEGLGNELRFKCVFNLDEDGNYKIHPERNCIKLSNNSLIVDIETKSVLYEKVICLEIVSTGHNYLSNSYKRFIVIESELQNANKVISKESIDDIFLNNKINKETISTIILDAIKEVSLDFFNK